MELAEPIPRPPARLLVVDDDLGLLRLIQSRLKREKFDVVAVSSGREALQAVETGAFTLLLLDLKLPDFSAGELIREFTKIRPDLPFVVITGQGDERVAVEMMLEGALDYLVKDAEFLDVLPARVRRAVDHVEQKERLARAEAALRREHAFRGRWTGNNRRCTREPARRPG